MFKIYLLSINHIQVGTVGRHHHCHIFIEEVLLSERVVAAVGAPEFLLHQEQQVRLPLDVDVLLVAHHRQNVAVRVLSVDLGALEDVTEFGLSRLLRNDVGHFKMSEQLALWKDNYNSVDFIMTLIYHVTKVFQ